MKFIHLSDLHIGKRVNGFSMLEDQEYILIKILNIIDDENPEAIIIAGDVYDKSVPPAEAVQLVDDFLSKLVNRKLKVFIISGNHDSPERLSFGGAIMNQSGVHISPVFSGDINPISLNDRYGVIDVFLLPFVKPSHVRRYFPEESINSYSEAVETAIKNMPISKNNRSIIISHQFVTGAIKSDSEEISVGGIDNVDLNVFELFDYVALGHIHRPQNIGKETIRYCGTPLKYSFSEANHNKSVTVVDMKEKDDIEIRTIPLIPKRDLREIRGLYMDITAKIFYQDTNIDDYLHITLTDEDDIPDAINKLRVIYPNIMKLDYDNKRTQTNLILPDINQIHEKQPIDLFSEFYEAQNGVQLSPEQYEYTFSLIKQIWGDDE